MFLLLSKTTPTNTTKVGHIKKNAVKRNNTLAVSGPVIKSSI